MSYIVTATCSHSKKNSQIDKNKRNRYKKSHSNFTFEQVSAVNFPFPCHLRNTPHRGWRMTREAWGSRATYQATGDHSDEIHSASAFLPALKEVTALISSCRVMQEGAAGVSECLQTAWEDQTPYFWSSVWYTHTCVHNWYDTHTHSCLACTCPRGGVFVACR